MRAKPKPSVYGGTQCEMFFAYIMWFAPNLKNTITPTRHQRPSLPTSKRQANAHMEYFVGARVSDGKKPG
jgi:hypothetical protein